MLRESITSLFVNYDMLRIEMINLSEYLSWIELQVQAFIQTDIGRTRIGAFCWNGDQMKTGKKRGKPLLANPLLLLLGRRRFELLCTVKKEGRVHRLCLPSFSSVTFTSGTLVSSKVCRDQSNHRFALRFNEMKNRVFPDWRTVPPIDIVGSR